jgi:Coproporphyrinogen III oxidase
MLSIKDQFTAHIRLLQHTICSGLEEMDGKARFRSDVWERPEGGGGDSRIMSGGAIFEKGGVNISIVEGALSPQAAQQLKVEGTSFFACGLSLVIHPFNPFVPTIHANWRYFELYDGNGKSAGRLVWWRHGSYSILFV